MTKIIIRVNDMKEYMGELFAAFCDGVWILIPATMMAMAVGIILRAIVAG